MVWRLFGKDADHVDILWFGAPPADAVRNAAHARVARRSGARARSCRAPTIRRGVPVYVIDPNGFVILRYAPGFDAGGLRADMAKLLKLM